VLRCVMRCLMPAVLAEGDESAMNLEGLDGSFSTYLLFSQRYLRVGSELADNAVSRQ
jgi:hypothetical protein